MLAELAGGILRWNQLVALQVKLTPVITKISCRSGRFMPVLWVLAVIAPEDGACAHRGAPAG